MLNPHQIKFQFPTVGPRAARWPRPFPHLSCFHCCNSLENQADVLKVPQHPMLFYASLYLEKAMAPHSSTLAWKIPWMEKPGRLQSTGSLGVGHNRATSLSLFTFLHWRRKWQPTPVFLPGESQGQGAWWPVVHGVTQSRTRLKQLSSSSTCCMLASVNNGRYSFICRLKSPFRNHLRSCLIWEVFLDLLGRVEQLFLCASTVPCLGLL